MSLSDKISSLFAGPVEKEVAVAPENAPAISPDACPCGGTFVEIAANIARCHQCGAQRGVAPRPASVPPVVKPRDTAPTACPVCSSSLILQIGPESRCQQCAWQSATTNQPTNGVPRNQLETFSGGAPGLTAARSIPRLHVSGSESIGKENAPLTGGRGGAGCCLLVSVITRRDLKLNVNCPKGTCSLFLLSPASS